MVFKKLKSKELLQLEQTDLKLIRAIEDIVKLTGIKEQLPTAVVDLINTREELRSKLGGNK